MFIWKHFQSTWNWAWLIKFNRISQMFWVTFLSFDNEYFSSTYMLLSMVLTLRVRGEVKGKERFYSGNTVSRWQVFEADSLSWHFNTFCSFCTCWWCISADKSLFKYSCFLWLNPYQFSVSVYSKILFS